MAPKKKAKKEKQELEEEAMAEWLSRGFNIKDFTMDKMLAIWLEEDGEGDEDGEGQGSLSAKQELMKGLSVLEPVIEQAKELVDKFKETAQVEASKALKTLWEYAEIPPLKRRRLLREHVVHVHEMDREANKYTIVRQRVMDEWETAQSAEKELAFGLKKRNARKAPLLLRSREMKDEADREQHARLMEDIERKRRERMDEELAEKQRQRDAKEQFADAQKVYRRKMNMKFWQKQYVDAKQYAEQHSLARHRERDDQFDEKVQQMKAEIVEMKAFDRQVTTSSLGVFGTPFEPGQWNSSIDGGHREGMDEHTVGLFSSRGFEAENELLRVEFLEAQSKVSMLREKLELVDHVKANLLADKMTIMERKNKLLAEIKQVNLEHDELGMMLAGPPRRDPTEEDKMHFHTLVTRRVAYMKQLQDLSTRESNIQKRSELAVRSESALQPMFVKAQEKEAELRKKVGEIEQRQTDLPMVVGRSIQRDAGKIAIPEVDEEIGDPLTVPLVNPTKLYTDVTMASKLKLLENAAIPVKEHFKKAKQLAIEDWKTKELKSLGEAELEVTKNRLGRLRDRLIDHQKDGLRADLMQAILRYHQGPLKLRKCIFPLKGRMEWWQSQEPSRSVGLSFDETLNVVYLDPSVHSGQIRGCVRLPKNCFFRISLSIRILRRSSSEEWNFGRPRTGDGVDKSGEQDEDVVDRASEKLTFYIGADYDSLQEHVFRDLGGKPIRAGPLTFEYYGPRLCFCFDLTHHQGGRPEEAAYRLVLENGASYEERLEDFREEESRMRLVQKEKHILSELVKTLRMQTKKTSSERCADLLQELVLVEKSKAKTWDSTMLHGYQQRFKRVEYAKMLRLEIKKELAIQIDQDVLRRQGRIHVQHEQLAEETPEDAEEMEAGEEKIERRDASRMEFLARKHALVEPQYLKSKQSLGEYCSFKAPESGDVEQRSGHSKMSKFGAQPTDPPAQGTYRKESIVMGIRLEWREGKTKLHVMHKLYGPDENRTESSEAAHRIKPTWCTLESTNAVFLASACAKALKLSREEETKEREVAKKKNEQVRQLHAETANTIQAQAEAEQREAIEDSILEKQKASELSRRAKLFHADAIRSTTYNEQVSAQVEFLAQRKKNALEQQSEGREVQWNEVLREVKEAHASKFVEGRLALVKKTWERKEKRLHDQREKEHRERDFLIHQERKRFEEIHASNQNELDALQFEHAKRIKDQLKIPNFEAAVKGVFRCEHRDLKAWGSKYDSGMRCKSCGKEMSKVFDEPDHMRGVDPQLDRDVEQHRGQTTGGMALRLRHPTHYEEVEQERIRLEKEAREVELSEALLYDRMDPKAIEQFNYRHNMNRHPDPVEGSDPMYQRTIQDAHHAAFQDEVLYHGRLKNYHFRIHHLTDLHAHTTTMIAVQKDFLANVKEENDFVLSKLPLVERDHARAVDLVAEDEAALRALEAARKQLNSTRKERERAYYALEGTEEEAEFAEFHAPSLIESSEQMTAIVERMREEELAIAKETATAQTRLELATKDHAKTENVLTRLRCRDRGTRLRTKYGFCRVLYYRDEDDCVVVAPERWSATIFIPVEQLVVTEEADRQRESAMMGAEDTRMRAFSIQELAREAQERSLMAEEEAFIHEIVAWRKKKEQEEEIVRTTMCDEELAHQFEYETANRKELIKAATEEAKKLNHYARVTLKRRTGPGKTIRPSKLDIMRVTRASEKRMAMAAMEQALLGNDFAMRKTFQEERDKAFVTQMSSSIYEKSLVAVINELCKESVDEELYDIRQFHRVRNHGLVLENATPASDAVVPALPVQTEIKLDRLWWARKKKAIVLYEAWKKEHAKLQALRLEIARRDEILRLEEEERLRLEQRRKEMLAEERYCRKFYLEEMVLCMQERKAMTNAEIEMREYMRLLEVEAMKAKYAKMVEDRNKANDKAARRLEIKLGKNEKHRLHREWAQIKIEDDLAMQIREEELARAQAEVLARQFDNFLAQQLADGKLAEEREAARLAERLREQKRIAEEKRLAVEAKLVRERMMATVEAYHLQSRLELEWMNAVERTSFWRHKANLLHANLAPMEVELARILAEKDHVVADAKAKRTHAELCKQRAKEADHALRLAIQNEEEHAKQYRKIHFLNSTMDSEVLHERPQRFRTVYLRDQLQTRYFYLLTESIIRRAIVECNEREAARLESKLRHIEEERAFKIKEIGVLKRQRRRHFRMQLKRSELGKLLFGKAQKRLITERFQQWVKLWSQRVLVRASFDVKHGLLMQQHRLQEKQTQLMKEDVNSKLTVLHQHQKRRVHCRLCKQEYTEEQNNRYSCSYHPGAYELACVQSCPTRQRGGITDGSVTAANCMMHRARRWLCCDATDEGRYGSNGCTTRFHLPVRANPALQELVEKKERQEETLLDQIQKQLNDLKERDTLGKAKLATKRVVTKAEQELASKRAQAAKYLTLDRR